MTAFKKLPKDKSKIIKKLNRNVIEDMCKFLRAGAYIETAAVLAGIGKSRFYDWIKLAHQQKKGIYRELLDAVAHAQEEATMRDLLNIDKCAMGQDPEYERYQKGTTSAEGIDISGQLILNGKGNPIPKKIGTKPDWAASAWRLTRRKPKQWGTKETTDEHQEDGSVVVNFTKPKVKE